MTPRASLPDTLALDVIIAVRADEAEHCDVNHGFAEQLRPASHRHLQHA